MPTDTPLRGPQEQNRQPRRQYLSVSYAVEAGLFLSVLASAGPFKPFKKVQMRPTAPVFFEVSLNRS